MSEETARVIIVAGGFVGLLVWLVALSLYRRMSATGDPEFLEARMPGRTPAEAISAVIDQVKQYAAMAKFTRPTPTSFSIEQGGVQMHFAAERAGGETRLVAGLDDARLTRRFQWGMGLLVLLVMPAVIVGLPVALWVWAAPNAQQDVRRQTLQIVQMVHVLWPPFLVYFVWWQIRKRMQAMASNLLVLADGESTTASAVNPGGFAR